MSKSRYNVVNPDDMVRQYGADAVRLYEMFMGPLDLTKPWQMSGVAGVRRFLDRAWRLVSGTGDDTSSHLVEEPADRQLERLTHKTIRIVTEDIEGLRFNTAISRLMEMANALTPMERRPRTVVETFVLLLSPFAPHIGEELWSLLGHRTTLAYEPWPRFDPDLARDALREYAVQVNGKTRHKVMAEVDLEAHKLLATVKADPKVVQLLGGRKIVREIAVPGRLVNFVVETT